MIRSVRIRKIISRIWWISLYVLILHFFFSALSSSYYQFVNLWWINQLNLFFVPISVAAVYASIYFLLPRYFYMKRHLAYILWQGFVFLLLVFSFLFIQYYILPAVYPDYKTSYAVTSILSQAMAALMILPIPIIYRISIFLYQNLHEKLMLQRLQLESELKLKEAQLQLLRHQLQPHFLFNTLNNLYSLAYHKSDQTLDVIKRISDLLNFVIYECNAETIPLVKEVRLFQNYIELEKIRYGNRLTVDFSFDGTISEYRIPPMLLFPFLENSFKHGASVDYKSPWIRVFLSAKDSKLTFRIENSLVNGEKSVLREVQPGVGIENTRRRLDLLYPGGYKLEIEENDKTYKAWLEIPLADH